MGRLIDADEFRREMYHEAFETDSDLQKWDSGCWIRYKMFENAIENFPAVDAVPVRHGHWVRIPNTPTWKCSICGYEITGFIDRDGLTPMDCKVNYCPRCGAKMDEVMRFEM